MSESALHEISGASLWNLNLGSRTPPSDELFAFPGNMASRGAGPRQWLRDIQTGDIATFNGQSNLLQSGGLIRKPPQSEGVSGGLLTQAQDRCWPTHQHSANGIDRLKTIYRFQDANSVEAFLSSHPGAAYILINAVQALKRFFGLDVVFKLQVLKEDDEQPILYAVAVWPGSVEDAVAALQNFDENWWLDQPTRGLALTFTYELA